MNLQQRFKLLDKLLNDNRQWWQFAAFHHIESRWQTLAPELYLELKKAQASKAEALEQQTDLSMKFSGVELASYIPDLSDIQHLCQVTKNYQQSKAPTSHWQYQIAGRKWSQITRFAPHVPLKQSIVEWCSGKGHLGRLAASHGAVSLLSLEWQQALCEKNQELNHRLKIQQHYCPTQVEHCDVMSENISQHLNQQQFPIALHACGDLHIQLVKQVIKHNMHGVCLAPCCYNLIATECYQPLSKLAKSSRLSLSKLDLSLPLKKITTAGQRERREQSKEKLWRIAFDSWQRETRAIDQYLPLPTIPKRILKADFKSFIGWASEQKNIRELLQQAESVDQQEILKAAKTRLVNIEQMEWVQHHFQRAIEIWLLLDQALYLEENGYQCEIFEFCELQFSPRNLMLKATRLDN